jgi:hypothetical protein
VITELSTALDTVGVGDHGDQAGIALRGLLTSTAGKDRPRAITAHIHCGGHIAMPATRDPVESALAELAVSAYPSFLLPSDRQHAPNGEMLGPLATGNLYGSPALKATQDAILADTFLRTIFTSGDTPDTAVATIYRSTFQGGSVQVSMLPVTILTSIWRDVLVESLISVSEFTSVAIQTWRQLIAALEGKEQHVRARAALTGVRLGGVSSIEFEDVSVRKISQAERDFAPASLKGDHRFVDATGATVVISIAGDLVAEVRHPYKVTVMRQTPDDPDPEFPENLTNENPAADATEKLRVSLLLSSSRKDLVQVFSSWQTIDDPLAFGRAISWADPRQAVGLLPTVLTDDEITAWQRWYTLVSNPHAKKIQVATSRVLRAASERKDPVDVLIDSVIAWECLFGSGSGESTLRITASLSILLESDPAERRKMREQLVYIYSLRSKAVHGTSMPKRADMASCRLALDIAIRAVRKIFDERSDLLQANSTDRSVMLLLGPEPSE